MNDDDKNQVREMIREALKYGTEFEQKLRIMIEAFDREKYLKRSEQWLDRLPFMMIGLAIGVIGALILSAHH